MNPEDVDLVLSAFHVALTPPVVQLSLSYVLCVCGDPRAGTILSHQITLMKFGLKTDNATLGISPREF